jgi:hypothetical protein
MPLKHCNGQVRNASMITCACRDRECSEEREEAEIRRGRDGPCCPGCITYAW